SEASWATAVAWQRIEPRAFSSIRFECDSVIRTIVERAPCRLKPPLPNCTILRPSFDALASDKVPAHSRKPRGQVTLISTTPPREAVTAWWEISIFGPPGRSVTFTARLVSVALPAGLTPVTLQAKRW